jgi:hypothetical protein
MAKLNKSWDFCFSMIYCPKISGRSFGYVYVYFQNIRIHNMPSFVCMSPHVILLPTTVFITLQPKCAISNDTYIHRLKLPGTTSHAYVSLLLHMGFRDAVSGGLTGSILNVLHHNPTICQNLPLLRDVRLNKVNIWQIQHAAFTHLFRVQYICSSPCIICPICSRPCS